MPSSTCYQANVHEVQVKPSASTQEYNLSYSNFLGIYLLTTRQGRKVAECNGLLKVRLSRISVTMNRKKNGCSAAPPYLQSSIPPLSSTLVATFFSGEVLEIGQQESGTISCAAFPIGKLPLFYFLSSIAFIFSSGTSSKEREPFQNLARPVHHESPVVRASTKESDWLA